MTIKPFTGKRCGPNETGEICVKTPFSMLCYLKRPKETEEYFDFEEFGHTGDLGFYDNKGWIVYVDRMKEVIKYNNNHVSPTEIEDILQKHEAVQECLVFGKKEPRVQELITAVVVSKHNTKVSFLWVFFCCFSAYFVNFHVSTKFIIKGIVNLFLFCSIDLFSVMGNLY